MWREISRKNKAIPREECIELLTRETRGVLSVNGDDGYPYAMPLNHYYEAEDGCIYFHSGRYGHKIDSVRASDKASLCVVEKGIRETDGWAYTVRSVIVFGRIEIVEDAERVAEITARLSRKFTSDEEYIAEEIAKFIKATVLLRLTPEHMTGKRITES